MILLVLVICCIGVAAGAAVSRTSAGVSDDEGDEMKSVNVTEGGNISISIQISNVRADTDPQVLVTRRRNSSDELIAQLLCPNGDCELETLFSGASLLFDGHNVTLVLMNVTQSQTGLYKLTELSSALRKSTVYYRITVFQAPVGEFISDPRPPVVSSEGLSTAGITAGVVCSLGLIAAVTAAIYGLCKKADKKRIREFDKISQQDDSAASSQSGFL